MKITISKEELLHGLQAVQNVVGTRSTLPILGNVLLKAVGKKLELRATDLDVSVEGAVGADVSKEGTTTLPAKRFFGLVREIENGEIEIEVNNKNECSVHAGASKYKLRGTAAEEFPALPKFKERGQVKIGQSKFREMLRKTSYAISSDETRIVLNGLFIKLDDDKISIVATDGRRMALVEEQIEGDGAKEEFIVPAKAIGELNRLMGSAGEIGIRMSDTQVEFSLTQENAEEIKIYSKLIEGKYPDYRQVIPKDSDQRVSLGREELLHALRRAEQVTSDKANSVSLNFNNNNLTISANSPEVGEGRESLAINYKGPEIEVSFNPSFLMDPLKILESDEVHIELKDKLSPGVLKSNTPFLYVLMPMRG